MNIWKFRITQKSQTVAVVVLLLAVFTLLSIQSAKRQSVNYDEMVHIPAGISYVQTKDLRLNPEHSHLVKYLSGLSATLFVNPNIDYNSEAWQKAEQYSFGRLVLSQDKNMDELVFSARIVVLLFSIMLGIFIFLLAKEFFGRFVAIIALALYTLDPTMIGFSHLVVFDLPMTAFVSGSVYFLWKAGRKTRHMYIYYGVSGVFAGLALCSKTTALLYIALVPILVWVNYATDKPSSLKKVNPRNILVSLGSFVSGLIAIVWLVYFVIAGTGVFENPGLLPAPLAESILKGLELYGTQKPMFILGEAYQNGRWWFFPASIMIKGTIVFIFGLVLGLYFLFARRRKQLKAQLCYVSFLLFVPLLFAISSTFNIGLRLIFIIYPALFIVAAFGLASIAGQGKKAYAVAGLATFYLVVSLAHHYPNYTTYSNEVFGGVNKTGYKYLADSNSDWGQGLVQLKEYQSKKGLEELKVIYFGGVSPNSYGLEEIYFGSTYPGLEKVIRNQKGWVAISATHANYLGLNKNGYEINDQYPKDVVAGSILVYEF